MVLTKEINSLQVLETNDPMLSFF